MQLILKTLLNLPFLQACVTDKFILFISLIVHLGVPKPGGDTSLPNNLTVSPPMVHFLHTRCTSIMQVPVKDFLH